MQQAAAVPKPARGRGRGRGGGRGRGAYVPDEGECSEECPETPAAKTSKKVLDTEALETPPKKSDKKKPKPKGKAKAKAANTKRSPKKTAGKNTPQSQKKKKKATDKELAGKRVRHSDEEKSFARRARPKWEKACNQWLAIRDAYNEDLFDTFGASRQDKQHIKLVPEPVCHAYQ